MENFLMKPKVDFAFKEIMMDEMARIGFLSAVLKLDPADIKETRILNTSLRKVHAEDKQGILDVRVLLNNSVEIDTEIQVSEVEAWANRSLFYLAKMYTEQIEQGQSYDVLKRCVSISVLDFSLFKDQEDYYSCFHIWEDTRHIPYTDKMEFHVIELPKLPAECREEGNRIFLWAKFIDAERKEEFDMLTGQDPYIDSAYQHLQVISQDKDMRMEYEARQKALLDYNQGIKEANQRGIKIGEQRGERRGKESVARNLIAAGFPTGDIVKLTGLTTEEVDALK